MKVRLFWTLVGLVCFVAVLGFLGGNPSGAYVAVGSSHAVVGVLLIALTSLLFYAEEVGFFYVTTFVAALHFFGMALIPSLLGGVDFDIASFVYLGFTVTYCLLFAAAWLGVIENQSKIWPDMNVVHHIAETLSDMDSWRTQQINETPRPQKFAPPGNTTPWWRVMLMHQFG